MGKLRPRSAVPEYYEKKFGVTFAASTLAKLATLGTGPAYRRIGRRVFYEDAELDRWLMERISDPVQCSWETEE